MKAYTLWKILNWFDKYQWNEDPDKMAILYEKLIDEEEKELSVALWNRDLVETLDAIWDILWVNIWYIYFKWNNIFNITSRTDDALEAIEELLLIWDKNIVNWLVILDDLMNEISNSNYTKITEKQTEWEKIGKIKKWPNFKKPDINKIILKYNLKLK